MARLRVRARAEGEGAAPRDARRRGRARAAHGPQARGIESRLVAGQRVTCVRVARRRLGGAGGRGGARAIEAPAHHRRPEVQVERRRLRVRPAPAGLRGPAGGRAGPPAHRRGVREPPSDLGAGRSPGGLRVGPPRGSRRGRRRRPLHGAGRRRGGASADADRGPGLLAGLLARRADRRLRGAHRSARRVPPLPRVRGLRRRRRVRMPDRRARPQLRADDGRGRPPVARAHRRAPVPGRGRGRRAALPDRRGPAAAPRSAWSAGRAR